MNRAAKKASRSRKRFSLVEVLVVAAVMAAMVGMAIPVWASVRENAYEARARQNLEYAERAVQSYWLSSSRSGEGYSGLGADSMNSTYSENYWIEAKATSLDNLDFENIPLEYFAAILIVHENGSGYNEIGVATIAETGKVFYSRFQGPDTVESCQLTFVEFKAREDQHLKADAL